MATHIHPIGFLSSVGGDRRGLGEDYVHKLEAAGRPAITFTNNDMGGIDDALAHLQNGSTNKHLCAFRVVGTGEEFAVPDYALLPQEAAVEYMARVQPLLPQKVNDNKQHIWVLLGNELDKNKADWIGEWAYESALLWNAEGYKVGMVGWASGTPEPEAWKTAGWVKFLRHSAAKPTKAAVNLHEYSYRVNDILFNYPNHIGRFQYLFKACDELGIPRVPVLIGEWGWEERQVPGEDQGRHDIRNVANLYSQFPQILGAGLWYLGQGYGGIASQAQRLIKGVGEDASNYQTGSFSRQLIIDPAGGHTVLPPPAGDGMGTTPAPVETPEPDPITTAETTFQLSFTGLGEKDVGAATATWFDDGNVQVPVINGRKMDYWAAEGENRFADGQPWNNFNLPEGVHRWAAHLPAQDHKFLNDAGRCYHLFAPAGGWWARFAHRLTLTPGSYQLKLDLFGDWVDIVAGVKQPKPDPAHARVELFSQGAGHEEWLRPAFNEASQHSREFTVDSTGEVEVGFGILTVFAPGGGPAANGCFIRSFSLEKVSEPAGGSSGGATNGGVGGDLPAPPANDLDPQIIQLAVGDEPQLLEVKLRGQAGDMLERFVTTLAGNAQLEIILRPADPASLPGDDSTGTAIDQDQVLGMDISTHQGKRIDFAKAAAAGVRFCFIRAGSGRTEKDSNFEWNFREAGKAGMLRGIYYYLYPESQAIVGDAVERTPEGQARRFVGLLKKEAELGAVLDVEAAGLTPAEVKRFVDEFQKLDPYGRPITIYTGAWYWHASRGYAGDAVAWAANHPL